MADESTLYWRASDPQKNLDTALGEERFDLIIADHRDSKTDVLGAVESLRKRQPESQIILICKKLELEEIIRAIRLGVRDVFNPPLDFKSLAGRIESLVRSGDKYPGVIEETSLGRWGELAMHLSETPVEEAAPPAKGSGRKGGAAIGTDLQLEAVIQERDGLGGEIKSLKKALATAEEAQQKLQEELAWTATLSEHAKSLEQEVQQLRQDQEALKVEIARRVEAEGALKAGKEQVSKLEAELARQAKSPAAAATSMAAEQTEQLEVERAMIDQQRRAAAKQESALQEEAARLEVASRNFAHESAKRERALQDQEKEQKAQAVQLAAGLQKLEAEQAVARQAVGKAEAAQQELEREKAGLGSERASIEADRVRLAGEIDGRQKRAEAAIKTEKDRLEKLQGDFELQTKLQAAKAEKLTAEQTAQIEMERTMLEQQGRALAKQRRHSRWRRRG
jgi:hypothetical protein